MYKKIFFVIVLCLFAACGQEPEVKKKIKIRPAILIEVGQGGSGSLISYPAVITGQKGSELAFTVGGVVKEVLVTAAQDVKKGQVLARLDQRDYQIRLNSAKAAFDNANREFVRAKRLLKESAVSRSHYESRKMTMETTKAQFDSARKAVDDAVITAPFGGKVSRVMIEAFQTAQPGRPVITLLKDSKLDVKINVPAHIMARSKKHAPKNMFIKLDAAKNRKIPVRYKEVSLEADPATQTYEVLLTFDPPDDIVVLPGMNATFWTDDPEKREAKNKLSIPVSAIGIENNRKFVWVVDNKTMKVSKRFIILENGAGRNLNVLSGLKIGETIVKAGISYLSEGMKVRRWSKS